MWLEVNQRVNYPVKRVLVEMESNGEIDMTDDVVKFCVSWTTISIIRSAIRNFVNTVFTRGTVIRHGTARHDYNCASARSHCAKCNRTELCHS